MKICFVLVFCLLSITLVHAQNQPWEDSSKSQGKLNLTIDGKKYIVDNGCGTNVYALRNYVISSEAAPITFSFYDGERKCNPPNELSLTIELRNFTGIGTYQISKGNGIVRLGLDPINNNDPTKRTSWEYEGYGSAGKATINVTSYSAQRIVGNLTATVMQNGENPKQLAGDFTIETTTDKRSKESIKLDQKNTAARSNIANSKGEFIEVTLNGKSLLIGSSCAFYRSSLSGNSFSLFVNENDCPAVTDLKSFQFDLQINNFKGKGIYKVSAARALRTGDATITPGGATNEQYGTEVDLGGLLNVTVTNASAGFIEGSFTGNLIDVVSGGKKKAVVAGKFKAKTTN